MDALVSEGIVGVNEENTRSRRHDEKREEINKLRKAVRWHAGHGCHKSGRPVRVPSHRLGSRMASAEILVRHVIAVTLCPVALQTRQSRHVEAERDGDESLQSECDLDPDWHSPYVAILIGA